MNNLRAAQRYSKALYGLAKSSSTLDSVDNELAWVLDFFKKNKTANLILLNSAIATANKQDSLGKVIPAEISRLVINFLKVLIKKKRFPELAAIQKEFHRLYERNHNVEEVTAITAVPLSKENVLKLQAVMKRKLNSEIVLLQKVDPRLIGGMIIRYAGNEINGSFRARLNSLEQVLQS